MNNIKMLCLSLFVLTACKSVEIPNTRMCSVAGSVDFGGDCAYTGSDKTDEMTFEEFIAFLNAGAICQSAEDFGKQKTAMDDACVLLGSKCTVEIKQALRRIQSWRDR